jgi:hypothetical protein
MQPDAPVPKSRMLKNRLSARLLKKVQMQGGAPQPE